MKPDWYHDQRQEVERILSLYPEKRSAIMPLLHLAQGARGYLTEEDMAAIAELIGETTAYVESVASFYAMYRRRPHGRFLMIVCDGLSCMLRGSERLTAQLEELLGIKAGETTPDGAITLETTHECLAACEGAPCLQVNHEYYLNVDEEKAARLVEALREAGTKAASNGKADGHGADLSSLALPPEPAPPPAGTGNGAGREAGQATRGARES